MLAALAYLRDPAWLINLDTGFRPWEQTSDGTRYRWTGGRASFFIPSTATSIDLPVRTTFAPGEWPVTVTITVDDQPAVTAELRDEGWHRLTFNLAGRTSRRVRRIDIHVDRTRAGNRGVAVGELQLR
ncbi:MAG: hypothetical protein ABIX28_05190 [Vicinamibacterales bacterium]